MFCLLFLAYLLQTNLELISIKSLPISVIDYLKVLLIVAIIVPIHEELIYRGLLLLVPYNKIKYIMLVFSSILFSVIHPSPIDTFWLSLAFGVLAIRFNSIVVPIVAHSIWNTFNIFFNF